MTGSLERYSPGTVDYVPPAEPTEFPGERDKPVFEYLMGMEPRALRPKDRMVLAGMTYEVMAVNTSYDHPGLRGYRYSTHIILCPVGSRFAMDIYAVPPHVFNVIREVR